MNAPSPKRFASADRSRLAWRGRWMALPAMFRHVFAGVGAVLLLLFLLSVLFRGSFSTWLWPDSRSDELRMQADAALQAADSRLPTARARVSSSRRRWR